MTVLVTGGAGYIGSHMVWELLDAGESVVVLDRLSTGFEWAVAPEAKLVVGDVADRELVGHLSANDLVGRLTHRIRDIRVDMADVLVDGGALRLDHRQGLDHLPRNSVARDREVVDGLLCLLSPTTVVRTVLRHV